MCSNDVKSSSQTSVQARISRQSQKRIQLAYYEESDALQLVGVQINEKAAEAKVVRNNEAELLNKGMLFFLAILLQAKTLVYTAIHCGKTKSTRGFGFGVNWIILI